MFSAKLLMLSGIGDAAECAAQAFAPVANLRGVGRNFQDHPILFGVVSSYRGPMPARSMASMPSKRRPMSEATAPRRPRHQDGIDATADRYDEIGRNMARRRRTASPFRRPWCRPTSRGKLSLASADLAAAGGARSRVPDHEHDLDRTVRCIEMCRELGAQKGVRPDQGRNYPGGHSPRLSCRRSRATPRSVSATRSARAGWARATTPWSTRNCASTA